MGHCGLLWVIVDHCGFWVVVDRCGSFWVVPHFSNYGVKVQWGLAAVTNGSEIN